VVQLRFGIISVLKRIFDVFILSEVWDGISSWEWLWLLKDFSIEFGTYFVLSKLEALLSSKNFFVNTEVWNEVVSWNWSFWFLNANFLTVLLLSFIDVKVSHGNIMINTEVWDEVVSWWWGWL
jgi:hypothetical protein